MTQLKDLPNELHVRIAESLCIHCTVPHASICPNGCPNVSCHCYCHLGPKPLPDHRASSAALAALCLTSRHFRDIATNILYHRPNTSAWWRIARTLINRPDLARHVKNLWFPEDFRGPASNDDISTELKSYYKDKLDTFVDSLPSGDAGDQYLRYVIGHGSADTSNMDIYEPLVEGNDFFHVTIMTSLCPNVEIIEAVGGYGHIFHFSPPGSLDKLQTLELCHYDTEYGISPRNLEFLFKAAPNLRTLTIVACADEGDEDSEVVKTSLRELDLQHSALGARALVALIKACPELESFKYGAGGVCVGYEQFNPGEARDALLRYAPNLKNVVLDLDNDGNYNNWEDWDEEQDERIAQDFADRGINYVRKDV